MELVELGYLLVGASETGTWRLFAEQVVGAMTLDGPQRSLYVKIDERAFRIAVLPGQRAGLRVCGWMVPNVRAFRAARESLQAEHIAIAQGDAAGASLRQVQDYFSFQDPAGHVHEIAWGPISDFRPFVSPTGVSGFVTETLGLGHIALTAPEHFDEQIAFWVRPDRFGVSDILNVPGPKGRARVSFLHCANERHHSLAFGEIDYPGGCIHIMLEVQTLDDVGRCLDRLAQQGGKPSMTLGRHVNDEMVSFYMRTPADFMLEIGCGGKRVDWSKNVVFETTRGSHWGHHPL